MPLHAVFSVSVTPFPVLYCGCSKQNIMNNKFMLILLSQLKQLACRTCRLVTVEFWSHPRNWPRIHNSFTFRLPVLNLWEIINTQALHSIGYKISSRRSWFTKEAIFAVEEINFASQKECFNIQILWAHRSFQWTWETDTGNLLLFTWPHRKVAIV